MYPYCMGRTGSALPKSMDREQLSLLWLLQKGTSCAAVNDILHHLPKTMQKHPPMEAISVLHTAH